MLTWAYKAISESCSGLLDTVVSWSEKNSHHIGWKGCGLYLPWTPWIEFFYCMGGERPLMWSRRGFWYCFRSSFVLWKGFNIFSFRRGNPVQGKMSPFLDIALRNYPNFCSLARSVLRTHVIMYGVCIWVSKEKGVWILRKEKFSDKEEVGFDSLRRGWKHPS